VDLRVAQVTDIDADELVGLYAAVGWTAYTKDPELLVAAVRGSTYVVAARRDGKLVGLARALSDGATICYLQDILVHPDAQRGGVGRALVTAVLEHFGPVRQQVLLTDDEPGQRAFYESLGFTEIRDLGAGTLRAFVRFN
jgi:ribosomal protein S18 acetylase RimI-like enzyme